MENPLNMVARPKCPKRSFEEVNQMLDSLEITDDSALEML